MWGVIPIIFGYIFVKPSRLHQALLENDRAGTGDRAGSFSQSALFNL